MVIAGEVFYDVLLFFLTNEAVQANEVERHLAEMLDELDGVLYAYKAHHLLIMAW
ncbi:hypothetical protein KSU1_C1071 [Candidatus Jettenia caeni]|uniref:Uncharacterized protein n=1 Tax=Candidatus Jettenia caeni TaxID=247490 RepID=I3ILS2_9BACT|nr:hypothetical protein KSU1_C1071 [Candidatus Jettenia caeni]